MTQPTASTPEFFAGSPARPVRQLVLLWLAVALLFQGFATQTHAHLGVDRTATTDPSTRVVAAVVDGQKNGPSAPACPLCEEKALFGAYLLTGSITIVAPVGAAYRFAAASLLPHAHHASSHAWRSRAPPLLTT